MKGESTTKFSVNLFECILRTAKRNEGNGKIALLKILRRHKALRKL